MCEIVKVGIHRTWVVETGVGRVAGAAARDGGSFCGAGAGGHTTAPAVVSDAFFFCAALAAMAEAALLAAGPPARATCGFARAPFAGSPTPDALPFIPPGTDRPLLRAQQLITPQLITLSSSQL